MTKPLMFLLLLGSAQAAEAKTPLSSMVSGLPSVGSISPGNAAGVLQYCATNKLVSSTSADSVLTGLKGKPNALSGADFTAGKAGNILNGGKKTSLASLPAPVKTQACDLVLKQAKNFL